VNTAGAVAGTLSAGFWLLPELGLRQTVAVAVALNMVAGVVALWAGRKWAGKQSAGGLRSVDSSAERISDFKSKIQDLTEPQRSLAQPAPFARALQAQGGRDDNPFESASNRRPQIPDFNERGLLGAFAAVGATAFIYEVSWTRLLATHLGSSTYAFTVMLAVFLTGIVLGSAAFEQWQKRWPVTLGAFAATQTLTAIAALSFLYFHQYFPALLPAVLQRRGQTFEALLVAQFLIATAAMLPAAVVFGFNFPVVTTLVAGRARGTGRYAAAVGRAYAANTVGAIVGAVAAGFWLVPLVGAYRLVAVAATGNVLLAFLLLWWQRSRQTAAWLVQGAVLGGCVLAAMGAFYDRALATYGTVLYWDLNDANLTLREAAATTDPVFVEDGLNATISVTYAEGYVALRTNGKVDASTRDTVTQLLLGHLGTAFHPAPKRVLVIGFGSGMTVSAVARYPQVEQIDCVEIEPAVIRAAAHLRSLHRGVVDDARLRIILDDARNYLLTTRESYDLIISEPSNPWIAGVSALFTDEFYREARSRLRPGGMFVQWVQAYSLYPDDFQMILATFAPHFAKASLWRAASSDYLLLGLAEVKPLELGRIRELWGEPRLRGDYAELGMERPEGVLGFHRLDDADLRRFIEHAPRNTDNRTQLEYNAPRALLATGLEDSNRATVWEFRSERLPRDVRVDDKTAAVLGAAETLLASEEPDEAARLLAVLGAAEPTAELELLRGRIALALKQFGEAREAFRGALRLDPGSLEAAYGLGDAARRAVDFETAELMFRQVLARDPRHRRTLVSMRNMSRARADWAGAAEWQRRLLEIEETESELSAMGEIFLRLGQITEATDLFKRALERDPYSYSAHRNLGEIYRRASLWKEAQPHLEHVVRYDPDVEPGVYVSISDVYRGLGRSSAALAALRKGQRLFPASEEIKEALRQ
jgi:spermidine synthase